MENDKTLARDTAAAAGACHEAAGGFLRPGLADRDRHDVARSALAVQTRIARALGAGRLADPRRSPWTQGRGDLPLCGKPPSLRSPICLDQVRGFGSGRGHYPRDLLQRHIQAAQQDDQTRGEQLALVIPPIAVAPIDTAGSSNPSWSYRRSALIDSCERRKNSPVVIRSVWPVIDTVYRKGKATSKTTSFPPAA